MSAGAEAGASRKKSASGYNEEQKWFHMETSFLCMEYFFGCVHIQKYSALFALF